MQRIAVAVSGLLLLCAQATQAQDRPRWANERTHATPADTSLSFTTSGTALSVLFDSFIAEAQGDAWWAPVSRTTTFSALVEDADPPASLRFQQHLRGAVNKDADARVVIVLVLPDRTETLVFPYGRQVSENLFRAFRSRLSYRELQEYTVSVFVRIDRRRPGAAARVDLDSWDATVSAAP